MIYKVYFGKSKSKTPYTVCAMDGNVAYIDGLKAVKAFCGGKLTRLRSGTYWTINNNIEYFAESEDK